jgi:hypothetical protein
LLPMNHCIITLFDLFFFQEPKSQVTSRCFTYLLSSRQTRRKKREKSRAIGMKA